jgi:large subunit ribosomal protein L35
LPRFRSRNLRDERFPWAECYEEKEKIVPKLKTNRGAAKRFKKTGTGRIKVKRGFARHILTKKASDRKRKLRTSKYVDPADQKRAKKLVPYL